MGLLMQAAAIETIAVKLAAGSFTADMAASLKQLANREETRNMPMDQMIKGVNSMSSGMAATEVAKANPLDYLSPNQVGGGKTKNTGMEV